MEARDSFMESWYRRFAITISIMRTTKAMPKMAKQVAGV
jgi:hypothetical protein